MDHHSVLSERKKQILKAIIDVHIRLGEPVGSKFLTQNEQIALSSATIRNEMAELEEMGYLEQPHTSAGRVPSSAGYRLYVDSLMNRYPVTQRETDELDTVLRQRSDALDKMLEQAGKMISLLTNYTSLIMTAGSACGAVRRFDAVSVDEHTFILVMTMDGETVQSKTVHTDHTASPAVLQKLCAVLNESIASVTPEQINLPRMMAMEEAMGADAPLITPVIKCVYDVIGTAGTGELRFEGLNRMLQYPEYSDVERIREMFEVLEHKDEIMHVIREARDGRVRVLIGAEAMLGAMVNATLIFRCLTEHDRIIGAIGVIGPCRMDYAKVVGLIDAMADRILETLGAAPRALAEGKDDSGRS